ncbi:hypothetical protein Pse7429DRAFT_1102 [Pseudanabaena biceps PCC 7429]|uniref:Uncharacterized protein n=1 Tax=Pseudanabaena biceps PCC 7429 TaxID=927668 RepID=L8N6M2_9CYAN|nr:hypothetical protein Pse7429DRAFT_1102 [Pseudanabaena biceps PCC 7429]
MPSILKLRGISGVSVRIVIHADILTVLISQLQRKPNLYTWLGAIKYNPQKAVSHAALALQLLTLDFNYT